MPASSIKSRQSKDSIGNRWLNIEEVRLVGDLRIMHSKVDELYQVVNNLRRRHNEASVQKYADGPVLTEDIARVDEIYMWFVKLKEQGERARR